MSFLLRCIGLSLIAAAAILIGRGYTYYTEKRIAEDEAFLNLFRHIRREVAAHLSTLSELVRSFEDDVLEGIGLLDLLRDGVGAEDAFSAVEKRLSIGADSRRVIGEYFADFGKTYRSGVLADTDRRIGELSEISEREREELRKNASTLKLLLAASALGIIILFI